MVIKVQVHTIHGGNVQTEVKCHAGDTWVFFQEGYGAAHPPPLEESLAIFPEDLTSTFHLLLNHNGPPQQKNSERAVRILYVWLQLYHRFVVWLYRNPFYSLVSVSLR